MNYYSERFGLVTDQDPTTENGQLFLAEYSILYHTNNRTDFDPFENARAFNLMVTQLRNSYTGIPGLYHRNPELIDRRIMSHDNILGIVCWSKYFGTGHAISIWDYTVKHFGLYDNTQGKSKQLSRFLPYAPQTLFIMGLCAESKLLYVLFPILFPFFFFNLIWDCFKKREETSSKIIDWLTFQALNDIWYMKLLNRFFEYRMRKQYGEDYVKELMRIFHGGNSKEFPINKILGIGV
jgi:hypothetical protein